MVESEGKGSAHVSVFSPHITEVITNMEVSAHSLHCSVLTFVSVFACLAMPMSRSLLKIQLKFSKILCSEQDAVAVAEHSMQSCLTLINIINLKIHPVHCHSVHINIH